MNKINIKEQINHPEKFNNPKQILKKPGLLTEKSQKEDYTFVWSIIAKILGEKGINSCIYKDNQDLNKLDGASLQYLFGGLTEKTKYQIKLDLNDKNKNKFIEKEEELSEYIDKLKTKFSTKLSINKEDILLVNPKYNNG